MTRSNISTVALLALATSSCSAFAPASPTNMPLSTSSLGAATMDMRTNDQLPYFLSVAEPATTKQEDSIKKLDDTTAMQSASTAAAPNKKAPVKPKAASGKNHKEGVFSPVVQLSKIILGQEELNKLRAKFISMHSDVIGSFVETSDSAFGQAVLKRLFELSDMDASGTVDKEELKAAFSALGFEWLKEKQVEGILKRADADSNGVIDIQEWFSEAPKTLRTNLVKLAKKNGGDMGLLV